MDASAEQVAESAVLPDLRDEVRELVRSGWLEEFYDLDRAKRYRVVRVVEEGLVKP